MLKQYLEAGKIVGTHGIKGELRVEPWCDSAQFLAKLKNLYWDNGAQPIQVLSSRPHKSLLLLTIQGIESATQADALRGRILYLNRKDVKLPNGSYFIQDMIGLSVYDADSGVLYGKLTDVMRTGANDVYQVTSDKEKEYLVPAIKDVIISIEPQNERIMIRPMRGIFDED